MHPHFENAFLKINFIAAFSLKGTATLMISMFYQKELFDPWILTQVLSKSVKNGKVIGI